jgi:hypothetical protein
MTMQAQLSSEVIADIASGVLSQLGAPPDRIDVASGEIDTGEAVLWVDAWYPTYSDIPPARQRLLAGGQVWGGVQQAGDIRLVLVNFRSETDEPVDLML